MGWVSRLLVVVGLLQVGGVALAEPAVNSRFVPVATTAGEGAASVVVERGDNLWAISTTRLGEVLGHEPTIAEIDPYWRAVISLNADNLRSGDPDLIYPGEEVTLPATTG